MDGSAQLFLEVVMEVQGVSAKYQRISSPCLT